MRFKLFFAAFTMLLSSCLDPGAGSEEDTVSSVNVLYDLYASTKYPNEICVQNKTFTPLDGKQLAENCVIGPRYQTCNNFLIGYDDMVETHYEFTVSSECTVTITKKVPLAMQAETASPSD
ncbi:MAG: hypothetical protein LBD73_04190 [Deferribacteraceae bacterium]|jgi:hypothetical protein|nr:hypothetical protein [Deferribacteraceae bacterium]